MRVLFMHLFVACAFIMNAQNKDGWAFKNEKEGVKVYYKNTSNIQEIKLISSIQSNLSGMIQLFTEVEHYPLWGYKVIEARLLKRISATEMYYYSRIDFPWPMSDRDLIMHSQMTQDPATKKVVCTSTAAPDFIPEVKDVVRVRTANTTWTLFPGTGGWLYSEYYIYSDPGGSIPAWLINMAIDVGPRETIKNIRAILRDPRYQRAKLPYIKD
ncbi:MAG: hypothetical protein KGS48_18295 [Bacteroidetes bacterium]|nr:hypothetical protein [Bacteroidota bacterium]